MVLRNDIVKYLNQELHIDQFQDYCPNGLQVTGKPQVEHVVSGVTASRDFLIAAKEAGADLVLVHHGYFWHQDPPSITGMLKERLVILFDADINLLAYHLPLDTHIQWGNNATLAKTLSLSVKAQHEVGGVPNLLWSGTLKTPLPPKAFSEKIEKDLNRKPLHIAGSPANLIQSVAWCTGAAQGFIVEAAELGVEAFITGEASERTFHQAKELGLHFFACGHHATERYGVQALGDHVAKHFGVRHTYIDIPNPI